MINRLLFATMLLGAVVADRPAVDAARLKPLITPISVRTLRGVVFSFDRDTCPAGWEEYTPLRGRSIVGVNPAASGSVPINQLPRYDLSMDYGAPTVTLTVAQMPSHTHQYEDIYFSESFGDSDGGPVAVPGALGSRSSDNDNSGRQIQRTTGAQGGGQPVPIQPPVRALLFCKLL